MCNKKKGFKAYVVTDGRRGSKATGRQQCVRVSNLPFTRGDIESVVRQARMAGMSRDELKAFYCERGNLSIATFNEIWPPEH